jgi:hypothetical protein
MKCLNIQGKIIELATFFHCVFHLEFRVLSLVLSHRVGWPVQRQKKMEEKQYWQRS